MRSILLFAVIVAGLPGCAYFTGRDEASADFEKETNAEDVRVREDKARTHLASLENAIADYYKAEKRVPPKLESLVPKYIASIPSIDLPACGRETDRVQAYPPEILRGGVVDGSRLLGTGRWGYVYDSSRVVVFVDCLKTSGKGVPWYQERGVY
ncbi:MAG: hypothetical protein HY079_04905 [Elusimicrobia bacterium]|nr:hypothetical protein [Elusimicrobiota bacterium]